MKRTEIASSLKIFIIWIALSFLLMGVDSLGWIGFLRGGIERLVIPVERRLVSVSSTLKMPLDAIRFLRTGRQRISDLERQVAELTVDATKVVVFEEENSALRKLIGAEFPDDWSFIPASVLSRGDTFSISAGRKQGVTIGDSVVWEDIILGTVVDVSENMSSLRRLSDAESRIPVYVPSTGARGLLEGRFDSQIVMSQILQEEEVKEGDTVVTSGDSQVLRGFVVGKVKKVEVEESDVYKEAFVEPVVNVGRLNTVFVVKEN